jgi:predicted enzyme related to lactoylglutathione lyase
MLYIKPVSAREGDRAVEPRMSLITLGVSDLDRAVAFYGDGLGWPKSEVGGDEVAFFKTGGVVIALFPRASFAADAGVDLDDVEHGGFPRFPLAHNVAEEEQVDSVLREAAEAGATIVKEAQEIFFGRHGFFADPEGFVWEVAWNPSFPLGADGSIELPD